MEGPFIFMMIHEDHFEYEDHTRFRTENIDCTPTL